MVTENGDERWRTNKNETKTHSINILVMGCFFCLHDILRTSAHHTSSSLLLIVPRQQSHRSHTSGPRGTKRQRNNGHSSHDRLYLELRSPWLASCFRSRVCLIGGTMDRGTRFRIRHNLVHNFIRSSESRIQHRTGSRVVKSIQVSKYPSIDNVPPCVAVIALRVKLSKLIPGVDPWLSAGYGN